MRIIPDSTGYVAVYNVEGENHAVTIPLVGWLYNEKHSEPTIQALVPDNNGIAVIANIFKGTDGELTFQGLDCGHFQEEDEDKKPWEN